jgi:sec-independent protein translocase protein TatC
LILAAILTPTPDPISQLIFAAPIFLLYELSILLSWFVGKKK